MFLQPGYGNEVFTRFPPEELVLLNRQDAIDAQRRTRWVGRQETREGFWEISVISFERSFC